MDQKTLFRPGDRVILEGAFEFDDGIVGTIVLPRRWNLELSGTSQWQGCRRLVSCPRGLLTFYMVEFDEPHYNDEGEGPYSGGEMLEESLRPLVRSDSWDATNLD